MKRWLDRNFGDQVMFLTTENNSSQVVVSKDVWHEVTTGFRSLNTSVQSSDMSVLKEAALILQEMILEVGGKSAF